MKELYWLVAVSLAAQCVAAPEKVVALNTAIFDQHIAENKYTLVEFYAPWCGHCKKLAPDYEKAAGNLQELGIPLAKVDATEEKALSQKYGVKGFPTILWFEDGVQSEFDGERNADAIVEWVKSMTGPAVSETAEPPAPTQAVPRMVLYGDSLLPGFADAAKASRRKASWYYVKSAGSPRMVLTHHGEESQELTSGCGDQAAVTKFLTDNFLPMYGKLDGDTFDKYVEAGKGLVWTMFPAEDGGFDATIARKRPMMTEMARKLKDKYVVTYTDTDKFRDALDNMLSVTEFPALAVQKKAGDKRKFVYQGEMSSDAIYKFIQDVDAGRVEPRLKSEPEPPASDDSVKVVVGSTLLKEVFSPGKDVLLEVYAPWCGHCKKLDPEYTKLAKKIQKEELGDLLTIAKIDGTANDSPVDSIDWSNFPTLFFVKAGSTEPMTYDGERTAKGLWKYIKKHATKAQEIKERLEKRKGATKKGEEL
mmetsp:Transcript_60350/g.155525  ORF Transcript_60350/g.155525 Transcript_60350/m.155525 type:complete len:477 (-) Transcript_60350:289-1719(-)